MNKVLFLVLIIGIPVLILSASHLHAQAGDKPIKEADPITENPTEPIQIKSIISNPIKDSHDSPPIILYWDQDDTTKDLTLNYYKYQNICEDSRYYHCQYTINVTYFMLTLSEYAVYVSDLVPFSPENVSTKTSDNNGFLVISGYELTKIYSDMVGEKDEDEVLIDNLLIETTGQLTYTGNNAKNHIIIYKKTNVELDVDLVLVDIADES